jgi:hypothetical protein
MALTLATQQAKDLPSNSTTTWDAYQRWTSKRLPTSVLTSRAVP